MPASSARSRPPTPTRRPQHRLSSLPWSVPAAAGLLAVEAVVIAEHARRLLTGTVLAEETLGLAALGPLDREIPVAVLELFAAIGLVIAAVSIVRRSRLALAYGAGVQMLIVLDIVLRIAAGLTIVPTVGLSALVLATGSALGMPHTRQWCDEPILVNR